MPTVGTAGSGNVDNSNGSVVYRSTDGGCSSYLVGVLSTSSNPALVNVEGLHAAGEFFSIPIGDSMIFRNGIEGIKKVTVKGSGGTAAVRYGVVAKV